MRMTLFYAILAIGFPVLASTDENAAAVAFPILALSALGVFIKSQVDAFRRRRQHGLGS